MEKAKQNKIAKIVMYVALTIVALVLIIGVVFRPGTARAGELCDSTTIETMKRHTPIPQAEIISKREVLGMCEVILKIGAENIPVYATDKFVLAGELFSEKKQITRETLDKLEGLAAEENKKNFYQIRPKLDVFAGITYTPKGKVKHRLYMFGSPLCGYCTKASREIQPILDETGTELVILLQGGGDARTKSIQAICSNVDLQGYNARKWETAPTDNCKNAEKKVDGASEVANQLHVKGVPTFFVDDGTMVIGANLPELKRILQQN